MGGLIKPLEGNGKMNLVLLYITVSFLRTCFFGEKNREKEKKNQYLKLDCGEKMSIAKIIVFIYLQIQIRISIFQQKFISKN